jgi:hypothetical protein
VSIYTEKTIAVALDDYISEKWGDKHGHYKIAARALETGQAELSLMVHGKRPPTRRILNAMGLERISAYVPKETR